jgi:hypothetical protein
VVSVDVADQVVVVGFHCTVIIALYKRIDYVA